MQIMRIDSIYITVVLNLEVNTVVAMEESYQKYLSQITHSLEEDISVELPS